MLPADVAICITSEFPRAIETAHIATQRRDIKTIVLKAFNEPRAGVFEGGPVKAYQAHVLTHGYLVPNPGGGESQVDALERYIEGFRVLLARDEKDVLAVIHGMPIAWLRQGARAALADVEFNPPDHNKSFVIPQSPTQPPAQPPSGPPDFRDPFVEFAFPYFFDAEDVDRALGSLTTWISRQRNAATT